MITQKLTVHPDDPQPRALKKAINCILEGGLIVYPTDSGYALACRLGCKTAIDRLRHLRHFDDNHCLTLVCPHLSALSSYASVTDKATFRALKAYTPGPFTFILQAAPSVRGFFHKKRKTIGLRVPDHRVTQALLEGLGESLISASLHAEDEDPIIDDQDVMARFRGRIDIILGVGSCPWRPTTVVDLTSDQMRIVRQGYGQL